MFAMHLMVGFNQRSGSFIRGAGVSDVHIRLLNGLPLTRERCDEAEVRTQALAGTPYHHR